MSLVTEDGKTVDVEQANLDFARAMTAQPHDETPIATPPPKLPPREPPKAKPKPPPKPKTKAAPGPVSDALKAKRAKNASAILETFAGVAEVQFIVTGDEAWKKDQALLTEMANPWGEAMAEVASHNPTFAKFLDSEGGTGAAFAYFALAQTTGTIAVGLIDNHNARGKVRNWVDALKLKLRFSGKNRKRNANTVDQQRAVR